MSPQTQIQQSHIVRGAAIEPRFPHGSIVEAFDTICESAADQVALYGSGITFGQLQAQTVHLAQRLHDLGVTPSSRVGLLFSTSEAQIISLLAVLRAGATYVPLDVYGPIDYALSLATHANCQLIIAAQEVEGAEAEDIVTLLFDVNALDVNTFNPKPELFRLPAAETACILFTSGTTGKPKGVPLSGDAILTRICWWNRLYPMQRGDTILSQLSAHTLGGTMAPLTALLQGCSVLPLDRDALLAVQTSPLAERQLPATDIWVMPSLVEQFIQQKLSLPKLKRLVLTGEHCSDALLQTVFELYPTAQILTLYGLTECAGHALGYCYSREETSTVLGKPSDNLIAWLLNEDLTPVDAGEPGLLYLSGRGLTERYLDPEMAAPVVSEPHSGTILLGTNDVVRLNDDGNLHYVGRRDRQVKIRGFRVDLNHVENLLTQLPEIRRAAVLFEREQMAAFLIPEVEEGEEEGVADATAEKRIRHSIVQTLPQWAIPQRLELMDALPLTATQKVHYAALKARLLPSESDEILVDAKDMESSAFTNQIIAAYNQVLQRDSTAVDDDFFHMGGDSFAVVQVVETLRATGITPQQIYQQRTARKLAAELERLLDDTDRYSADYDANHSLRQPLKQTELGLFAEALMGFAYIEVIPKWLLALAIPWLQRRFYLTILERAILFERPPDAALLQSNLLTLGERYPIFRATAVIEDGHWARRLEVLQSEITLLHCTPQEWESLRQSLRNRLSTMTESLIFFVLADRVLYILGHHSVCDYYTLNQLTRLLGRQERIVESDCFEKAPINELEEWRRSQVGLVGDFGAEGSKNEELLLSKKVGSWAIPAISRRTAEKISFDANWAASKTEIRLRTYAAWLATLYKVYGRKEITFHEVVDLRNMPWLPYQYADTIGLMASLCRLTLRYDPANSNRQTLDSLQEQLANQVQMENIWQHANWQMAQSLDRSWIFNFLPYPTNLGVRYQDRLHPAHPPLIQQQRTIECIVHMQESQMWMELVYDQLRYSRSTVAEFLRHFRLEYGLIYR